MGAEPPRAPRRALLIDWGDTLMRDIAAFHGPMVTWPRVETLPDAAETLAALRPNWWLALATNAADSDEGQIRAALERGGLGGLLDRIYCRRNVGQPKPSAAFFAHVLADLGVGAEDAVMVGDSLTTDVVGALQCGLWAVWLHEGAGDAALGPRMRTAHGWREVPATLAALWGEDTAP
ncbi:MAG: HAD family hydrolase [Anaerolineae bacterium]